MKLYSKAIAQAIVSLSLAILMAACADSRQDTPVPRRHAYPRPLLYPAEYVTTNTSGLSFDVNAAAEATSRNEHWLDINYPAYRGTIHISVLTDLTHEQLRRALDNRRERIALNIGDSPYKVERFTNPAGYDCEIIVAPEAGITPVQCIAIADDRGTLASGTFAFADNGSRADLDSISPIIDAVLADTRRALDTLR